MRTRKIAKIAVIAKVAKIENPTRLDSITGIRPDAVFLEIGPLSPARHTNFFQAPFNSSGTGGIEVN